MARLNYEKQIALIREKIISEIKIIVNSVDIDDKLPIYILYDHMYGEKGSVYTLPVEQLINVLNTLKNNQP